MNGSVSGDDAASSPSKGEREFTKLIESIETPTGLDQETLSERLSLTIITVAELLRSDSRLAPLAAGFLFHAALLEYLPLSSRRVESVDLNHDSEDSSDELADQFLARFADVAAAVLDQSSWRDTMASLGARCDVVDLVDGRLFKMVLFAIGKGLGSKSVPATVKSSYGSLAKAVGTLCGVPVELELINGDSAISKLPSNGHDSSKHDHDGVLPFSNAIFDKHLDSIKISVDRSFPSDYDGVPPKIHRELTHWHNAKRPLVVKVAPVVTDVRTQKRAMRSNQFYMADMLVYAASLTSSAGRMLEPELITVTKGKKGQQTPAADKRIDKKGKGGPSDGQSQSGKKDKANPGKKAMLSNIAAQKDAKESDVARKLFASWQQKRQLLDGVIDPKSRYSKTRSYLKDLPDSKKTVLEAEVKVYMLQALVDIWVRSCKDASKQKDYGTAALIWDALRGFSLIKNGLTETIVVHVVKISSLLEMPLPKPATNAPDRKPSFTFTVPSAGTDTISIAMSAKEFQLLQCGPYMDRNVDSSPDPRVPFEPDAWQKKVLDEIDANRSVFVVAPTSAGKTFISFYAMEQTLRVDDNGILVYVAPTKALVNQIAAEIQGRFKKSFDYPGKTVWAIHTRDYRIHNPMGCQILVTVPHVLQIMLMSPTNANSWSSRVKRIIFDEIHSIGQAEDGVVWEQLLLLSPCPIIALSATVGNPEQFNDWMATTQRAANFDLTMISHSTRYSDLRKFMYVPPKRFAFKGLADRATFARLGLDEIRGFAFVHPVASLVNKSRGMPDDLTLEARDCFTLWQAISKYQTSDYPVDDALGPEKSLPRVIRKVDVTTWERRLKALLLDWMTDDNSPFDKVWEALSKSMSEMEPEEIQVSRGSAADIEKDDLTEVDPDNLYTTTLPMLSKLHERDALPAILFNYDRTKCENMALAVLGQLKTHEAEWKETSPKWKAFLKGWDVWKKVNDSKKFKKPAKPAGKKGRADEDDPVSKADQNKDSASEESSQYENFNPDAPHDMFSFADKRRFEAADLDHYFWQLGRKGVQPWLMEALTRGIGVHHAGMNRKYRQIVEILFRKGYLRVVIATGTLALGINMPCATVVFSGDSVFLTALNFRQGAGRAGRRGFDLLGNVVFQGLTADKACRLLSSRLPDLNGHFPITTTLVLRLFILLHDSNNSAYATRAINSLLSQPRLYLGGDDFRDQVLHHLRFSIEYLRRQGLLGADGAPHNFAGCITHLYFTENSSFAFHALLKAGYLHELCRDIDSKESKVLESLMLIMAHLFGRQPCRRSDEEFLKVVKQSSSLVFLPPMPEKASAVLREHNQETLQIFSSYVRTFAAEHMKNEERELPLTGVQAGGKTSVSSMGPFSTLPSTQTRSAFVALSGHGDQFDSVSDLCDTTRQGIFLEKAIVPHVDIYPDESGTPLNAYLYDFFKHGDVTQLQNANGIRKGDVWFVLNGKSPIVDFSLVLATIITSLSVFMKLSTGSELDMLDVIGSGEVAENAQDGDIAEAENSGNQSSSASQTNATVGSAATQPLKKKKAKVADDWEAAEQEADAADAVSSAQAIRNALADEATSGGGDERGLMNVLKALQRLKTEFDFTFRKMWA
ncbi:MAG: hypothetical protein M1832_004825 [Thelocarpon impressellum]|nr:MAG: hypothetical protein M1832_004825 [Thelocarpon impressellum]